MLEGAPRPTPKKEKRTAPVEIAPVDMAEKEKIRALSVDDTIKGIDFILDNHEVLRDKWEEMVENLPMPEQLAKLEDMAAKRREKLAPKPYISSKLEVLEHEDEFTEKLFDDIIAKVKDQSDEIGRGYNGRIVEYRGENKQGSNTVYKVLMRAPIAEQNDLLSEASYLADLYALAETYKEIGVGVPKPYYCATLTNARVIAMQKVPGVSIEDILTKNIPLPEGIDVEKVEQKLLNFVEKINTDGFYHNDLRTGNIMLALERERESLPEVYIVDTGSSKSSKVADIKIDTSVDRVMLRQAFESLKRFSERQQEEKKYD